MHVAAGLRHLALLTIVVASAGSPAACVEGAPEPEEARALRQNFPEQAGLILDATDRFVLARDGFSVDLPDGTYPPDHGRLRVTLPASGSGAVRFSLGDAFEARVREVGVTGRGVIAANAVAYARAGGTSFWTAASSGYEEWLMIGAARRDAPIAAWEVEGGKLRQAGSMVEVTNDAGAPRLRVEAPSAFAAGGRPVAARLTVRDATIELWVDATDEAVLVDPLWKSAASMATGREWHTATLLPNGKVLVTGGLDTSVYKSCELYDPVTDSWSAAAPMLGQRYGHTATLLPNGKVLVVGGMNGVSAMSKPEGVVELYTPATNTWQQVANLVKARYLHTATLLNNGKVLIAAGHASGTYLADCELFDSATNNWSSASVLAEPRIYHSANLLPDGRVLLALGAQQTYLNSTEIYNPATNAWTTMAVATFTRSKHGATILQDGRLLVAGGFNGAVLESSEIYDPTTDLWTPVGSLTAKRDSYSFSLLSTGKVLGAAGFGSLFPLKTAELFNPVSNAWEATGSLATARNDHVAVTLANGQVLITGGFNGYVGASLASTEIFGNIGEPCNTPDECTSGFCVDGVCCNAICDAGICDACSLATGSSADGTCTAIDGGVCDDADACTSNDVCTNGACLGSGGPDCTAQDACHDDGVCDPITALCVIPTKADGVLCDDEDACTLGDVCTAGACVPGTPVECTPLDDCHDVGLCDTKSGVCSVPEKADDVPCDDGDLCTTDDVCQKGVCGGGMLVACDPMDDCHEAGLCDSMTGMCSESPQKADGELCAEGICTAGVCGPVATGTGGSGGMGGTGGAGGSGGAGGDGGSGGAGGDDGTGGGLTTTSGTGAGKTTGETSGCGCGIAGSPAVGGLWAALGIVLLARRRREHGREVSRA